MSPADYSAADYSAADDSAAGYSGEEGWTADPALCSHLSRRVRRPVPPPFADAVAVVGSLPVTVDDAPYRPTVHVAVGEGE